MDKIRRPDKTHAAHDAELAADLAGSVLGKTIRRGRVRGGMLVEHTFDTAVLRLRADAYERRTIRSSHQFAQPQGSWNVDGDLLKGVTLVGRYAGPSRMDKSIRLALHKAALNGVEMLEIAWDNFDPREQPLQAM